MGNDELTPFESKENYLESRKSKGSKTNFHDEEPDKPGMIERFINNFKKYLKIKSKYKTGIIALIILTFAIVGFFNIKSKFFSTRESVKTSAFASLKEVTPIKNLSTLEYTYNSMTKVLDGENIKYHVAYSGKVISGIDTSKINYEADNDKKVVVVTLPKVTIQDVAVDINSLDFIFVKDKYNTETVAQEGYKACVEDIRKKVQNNIKLNEFALDNAKSIIEASCKSLKPDYKVVFK